MTAKETTATEIGRKATAKETGRKPASKSSPSATGFPSTTRSTTNSPATEGREAPDAREARESPVEAGTGASLAEAYVVGLAGPFVLLWLFVLGHDAIDSSDPAVGEARMWYFAALVGGLAMGFAMWRQDPERFWVHGLVALAVAIPVAFYIGSMGEGYGWGGLFLLLFLTYYVLPIMGLFALAIGITAVVLHSSGRPKGAALGAIVGGAGIGLGIAGAAGYHLMTLTEQAEAAREANDTPGLGILVVLCVLAATALVRRRAP